MRRPAKPAPDELSIADGLRHLGHLTRKGEAYECFDSTGNYLCKAATLSEGRAAIIRAGRVSAA